jgi:hypothetical protein
MMIVLRKKESGRPTKEIRRMPRQPPKLSAVAEATAETFGGCRNSGGFRDSVDVVTASSQRVVIIGTIKSVVREEVQFRQTSKQIENSAMPDDG